MIYNQYIYIYCSYHIFNNQILYGWSNQEWDGRTRSTYGG